MKGRHIIFIGSNYENGNNKVNKNPEKAKKWYQMAAEAGVDYGTDLKEYGDLHYELAERRLAEIRDMGL